jgi:hypothetical protein
MAKRGKAVQSTPTKTGREEIVQITPIIIKGGDSLHIHSDVVLLEDDDGKLVDHVKIKNKGSITEVQIRGGIGNVTGDGSNANPYAIKLTSKKATVHVNFMRES